MNSNPSGDSDSDLGARSSVVQSLRARKSQPSAQHSSDFDEFRSQALVLGDVENLKLVCHPNKEVCDISVRNRDKDGPHFESLLFLRGETDGRETIRQSGFYALSQAVFFPLGEVVYKLMHFEGKMIKPIGKSRRADVITFERDLERNLLALLLDLEGETYRHGAYQSFELKDSKRRRIDKATVRDRIVHELLFRSLQAVFEPLFISDSFSGRTGKGTVSALGRADEFLAPWREGAFGWHAIVGDIRSFFASVPHGLLLVLIARRVKDAHLFDILEKIIHSFSTNGRLGYGIPLGNVTSQIFANIVLHELDRRAKIWLRLRRYMRYNDDILAVVHGRGQVEELGQTLQTKVQDMGFDLKIRIFALTKRTRFDWLGASIFSSGRTVRCASVKRIVCALDGAVRQVRRRSMTENTYRHMLTSYRSHIKSYGS